MHETFLINKSKEGDEKAFTELVQLYRPRIVSHILSIVKDESITEDLTQEAFISAYHHIGQFQQNSSFFTWLWRIGHNKALAWLRTQKKRPTVEFKEELYYGVSNSDDESKEIIPYLLQFLPEKQRVTYQMFAIERLSQKEIAARLGVPLGTVRSRIYYARKNLIVLIVKERDKKGDAI